MKNVIILVCDGLPYDMTIDFPRHRSPMKFTQSLREKSLNCSKAYSHGPYTEAGIMGLMYGRNPLDDGAYLSGMQEWDKSLYKCFYDSGYELFTSYFGSYTPPELMINGKYVYAANYFTPLFSRYIRGKLDYYRPIFNNGSANESDLVAIKKLLLRHFESMLLWHSSESEANDCIGDYQPCKIEDESRKKNINQWKEKLDKEKILFDSDSFQYIHNIFENYDSHFLTNECNVSALPLSEININQRLWIKDQYKYLFSDIKRINRNTFLKNKQIPVSQILHTVKDKHKFAEYLYRTYNACFEFDTSKMLNTKMDQLCTSARAFARSLMRWIDERQSETPFFSYLHFDEFHRPVSFFSHDIFDRDLISEEMRIAEEYIKSLPKNYKGNVYFDLAALYLDCCIKELYDYLDAKGILKNTIFIITADHGSSNFGENVRFTLTNNFYPEQYHIPFILYNNGLHDDVDTFINIKNIPYTVCKEAQVQPYDTFCKGSIRDIKNDNTFVEYLGTGVPDLLRRPVYYEFRDENEAYVLSVKLFDNNDEIQMLEYYNLKDDPNQFHNLAKKLDNDERNKRINRFRPRCEELRENYLNWCKQ